MKKDSTFVYFILIILSAADIVGILFCSLMLLRNIYSGITGNSINSFIVMWGILCLLCVAAFPLLDKKRKDYREKAEYTEDGISKRYGNFRNLSSEERKHIEQQKMMDNERILDSVTFSKLVHKGTLHPNEEMQKLTGLQKTKECMHEMAARMAFEQEEKKKRKRSALQQKKLPMHMVFAGAPGTGKTTCARIMTGFLYKYHYIRKNQCVETDGSFLLGNNPGESSRRIRLLIQKSLGGVLFIDEAYALLYGGQEIIASIVKTMEDRPDDLVFIFAGYKKEMAQLIGSNPGLSSRIKYHIPFNSFSSMELCDIFHQMANEKGYCVSAELMQELYSRMEKERTDKNFGNARAVRNILDKIIDRHAVNCMDKKLNENERYILSEMDIPKEM